MAINFPDSPATNDTFTSGGKVYQYSGTAWNLLTLTQNVIPSNSVSSASIIDGSIVNADVNAAAAITYGKLSLSNSVVNADINTSAAIAYSKINLANSIVNADINTAAAITKTKISGTAITAADTATVTNAMLANTSVTIGSTAIALGGTSTTIAGLTSLATSNANVSGKLSITSVGEPLTVSATAATGTITIDYFNNPTVFYTANATANWTLNVRGNSILTMNNTIAVNEMATVVFMAQQGATAYYANVIQIDGTTITPKWQGGTAPSSGNVTSIDSYALSILKTAANTYTVFASQTKFA
jgi:hypothetical protein